MTGLLEKVLDVHGGLDNGRRVNTIDFHLTLRGSALEIKQQPHGLRDVLVKIDTRRPRTLITAFPASGSRGIFNDGRVTTETDAGAKTSKFDEPRKSFEGHEPNRRGRKSVSPLVGHAFQNCMTMPFSLTKDGVHCEEIAPHEEHGESWRVLKVTFLPSIHVHCPEWKF
jgi:hypothetical protein